MKLPADSKKSLAYMTAGSTGMARPKAMEADVCIDLVKR